MASSDMETGERWRADVCPTCSKNYVPPQQSVCVRCSRAGHQIDAECARGLLRFGDRVCVFLLFFAVGTLVLLIIKLLFLWAQWVWSLF